MLKKHLEEEEVLGKTGRPVSSSTVNCPHSSTPTLQLRQILWSECETCFGTCSRGKGTSCLLEKNRSITCSTNLYQSSIWKDPGAPKKGQWICFKNLFRANTACKLSCLHPGLKSLLGCKQTFFTQTTNRLLSHCRLESKRFLQITKIQLIGTPSKHFYRIIREFFSTWGGGSLPNSQNLLMLEIALKSP